MIDGLRKGDIPTAKEMEAEASLNLTESVLKAYLESNGFVPGNPPSQCNRWNYSAFFRRYLQRACFHLRP